MHTTLHAIDSRSIAAPIGDSTRWESKWCRYSLRVVVLLALLANGCGVGVERPKSESVTGIESNLGSVVLYGDDSIQARAWATGSSGDSVPGHVVALSALTPAIASISASGVIHTRANGTAEFLATTDGLTATISLMSFVTHIARITVNPDSIEMTLGQEFNVGDSSAPVRVRAFDPLGNEMHGVPFLIETHNSGVVAADYVNDYNVWARGVGTAVLTVSADTASTKLTVAVTRRESLSGAREPSTTTSPYY